ncbi:MAG: DUF2497 domain-containing protein [Pseudomonadota bacterium]
MGPAMAEQAQKEPSMEEILSSIRKIIADDDAPAAEAPAPAEPEASVDDLEMFDDEDLLSADAAPIESEEDVLAAISRSMEDATSELEADAAEAAAEEEVFDLDIAEDSFEAFEDDAFEGVEDFAEAELAAEPIEDSFEPVEEIALEPAIEAEPEPAPEPEPLIEEEKPMAAAAPLTDTATVTAAAGALSKLLSNVEFGEDAGGATTIEGLVREMMRPMLKEWLDENLPGIVEQQVEAEVKRIARMAG